MSLESVFLPLALQYDPEEHSSIQKAFGVTDTEVLKLMRAIGTAARSTGVDEGGTGVYSQDIFMRMVRDGEVSANMVLYMACSGTHNLWESFADGIFLVLDAEDEQGAPK